MSGRDKPPPWIPPDKPKHPTEKATVHTPEESVASDHGTLRPSSPIEAVRHQEDAPGVGVSGPDAPPSVETDRLPGERVVQPRRRGSSDEEHGDEKRPKININTPPTPNTPSPPPPSSRIPLVIRSVRSGPSSLSTSLPTSPWQFPPWKSISPIRLQQPCSPSRSPPHGGGGEALAGPSGLEANPAEATSPTCDMGSYAPQRENSPSNDVTLSMGIHSVPIVEASSPPMPAPTPSVAASYAAATASPPPVHMDVAGAATSVAARSSTPPNNDQQASQKAYPPIVVEYLPNWTNHFANLQRKLGHAPNARPLGKGVRFIPRSPEEYRVVQRHLTDAMQTDPTISWYCYSMTSELPTKVAIRGLPADTNPADIQAALEAEEFGVRFVRPIRPRRGRAGCLFHVQLDHLKQEELSRLFSIRELLYMPGIIIEAWRGTAGGVAQCHRCQAFGHASANCHRPLRCVRCGDGHPAKDCPRPLDAKPTCANCGKKHTANDRRCAVYREARKRGKRTIAPMPPSNTIDRQAPFQRRPGPEVETVQIRRIPAPVGGTTLHTAANPPTARGAPLKKRLRRRRRRRRGQKQDPVELSAPLPTSTAVLTRTGSTAVPEAFLDPPEANPAPVPYRLPEVETRTLHPAPWASRAPWVHAVPTMCPVRVLQEMSQDHTTPVPPTVPTAPSPINVPLPVPVAPIVHPGRPQHYERQNYRTYATGPQECPSNGGSVGNPMLLLLGILADLLASIVAGEDLREAAMRGLATIRTNQTG